MRPDHFSLCYIYLPYKQKSTQSKKAVLKLLMMANTPATEENGGGYGKRPPSANPSTSGGLLSRMWSSLRLQKAQRPAITNSSAASTSSMIKRSESDRVVGGLHSNGNHYAKGHQRPSFTVKDNGERCTAGVQQGSHMNSINGCGNEKGLDRRRRPSSSTKALRPILRNG